MTNIIKNNQIRCKKCLKWHNLEYQLQTNNTKHLVYRCPLHKKGQNAVEFLPFIPDLSIETYSPLEEQLLREEYQEIEEEKQVKLF